MIRLQSACVGDVTRTRPRAVGFRVAPRWDARVAARAATTRPVGAEPPPRQIACRPKQCQPNPVHTANTHHFVDMAVLSKPVPRIKRSDSPRFIDLDYGSDMPLSDATEALIEKINQLLKCRLRDWQAAAVQSLLYRRDVFVKAGTGSGKSAVFQSMIAAKENAVVLVIAPLKSLMSDQVSCAILNVSNNMSGYSVRGRRYPVSRTD
jgi:ATP-dependent helicase YprA (DUF1998 family)